MGLFDNILDWAADKVQTVTGEKERRELVQLLKDKYIEFKEEVERKVEIINSLIDQFNQKINIINGLRKGEVKSNIISLSSFLGKFGNIKSLGEYTDEKEAGLLMLPEQRFIEREKYISDVDWSQDEVFMNSFFLSPIGMKMKTRKQNLSMREQLHEFELEAEETLNQLRMQEYSVEQNKEIADLYIFCIQLITGYIKEVILPELDVVEAFFQAIKIKNEVIVDNNLQNLSFSLDISLLKDTQYQKHYMFVKNAFLFYVISCKIYNTPILTKLISGTTEKQDVETLQDNKKILLEQRDCVNNSLSFKRGNYNEQ